MGVKAEVIVENINTKIITQPINTKANISLAYITYYPLSVSSFACFPQTNIEGMRVNDYD